MYVRVLFVCSRVLEVLIIAFVCIFPAVCYPQALSDCNPNWSPKLDQITDPVMGPLIQVQKSRAKAWIDESVAKAGGLDQFLRGWEEAEALDQDQLNVHENAGDQDGVQKLKVMLLVNEAMLEIGTCRKTGKTLTIPALSPRGFNKLGPNPIDKAFDDVLNDSEDCKKLIQYRDGQLSKDFDAAMSKYDIFKEGKLSEEKIRTETLKLMDNNWWGGETGVSIAIELRYYSSLVNDIGGIVAPEEYFVQVYGHVAAGTVSRAKASAVTIDLLKTEEEEGAKKAALDATVEIAKDVMGRIGSLIGIFQDIQKHSEDKKKLLECRAAVQEQVATIDGTMRNLAAKMSKSRARTEAIADLVAQIDSACNARVPSIPVNSSSLPLSPPQ